MNMLKTFRRRFIILNMSLVGIVLLIAFVIIGVTVYTNEYAELKNTMSNVLKPWNTDNAGAQAGNDTRDNVPQSESSRDNAPQSESSRDNAPQSEDSREKEPHTEKKEKAPDKPEDKKEGGASSRDNGGKKTASEKRRERNDYITTIFYYKNENRINVMSDTTVFDEEPDEVVSAIMAQDDSFGTADRYQVIYYRQTTGDMTKIAVCSESYITSRMVRTVLILFSAFTLSMLLLFLVSMRLARFAEKPLRQSIEMERKFVADISHDLKTPITVIMANNSILKANRDSTVSDNMQWIESTDRSSEDMMQLIGNMLTMSAVDTQTKKVNTVPVSLTSAAERCVLQFESVAYEKNVTLEESVEEELTVSAAEEYLKRICSSLIENAVKYEPEGGKVTVRAYGRKHKAYFEVRNLNSRISPEDLPHIFDRFYRGDKARTESKGHGLGLPIIRQMAELCGASIEVQSSEREGTVFTVTFRRA